MTISQKCSDLGNKLRSREYFGEQLRKTKVIYIEGDTALRSLISNEIRRSPLLDLVFEGPSLSSAIDFTQRANFDVALVETCHGEASSGQEMASTLRRSETNCGIVLYSQEASLGFLNNFAPDDRIGISILQKRSPVDFDLLFRTLVRTAQGHSSFDEALVEETDIDHLPAGDFSIRDNAILIMLVDGKNNEYIARALNLAPVTVRQEVSRIYRILVPFRTEGTHLRTEAVAAYLKKTKQFDSSKKDHGERPTSAADAIARPADWALSKQT